MRILIVNPPHPAIGSRIPDDHLPPLGLLGIGRPLLDDGHDVTLLDAEFGPMPMAKIVARIAAHTSRTFCCSGTRDRQSRPKALWRLLTLHFKDRKIAHAQRWYYRMGKRVWFHEVSGFLFRDRRIADSPTVEQFRGRTLDHEEEALAPAARKSPS